MSDDIKIKLVLDAAKAIDDAKKLNEAFGKLTDAEKAAATALIKQNEALANQAKELKKAEDAAAAYANTQTRAHELLQRGVGGGEFAEGMQKVGQAFAIAGDRTAGATARLEAFVGGAGIGARSALGLARSVVSAGDSLAAFSRQANHVAETPLSLWWENAKRSVERFAESTFRLGESLAAVHPGLRFLKGWAEAIIAAMGYAGRAFDFASQHLDALTGTTHAAKDSLHGATTEAGELAGKLSLVDVAARAVKDSTHQFGEKLDAGQMAARGMADTLRTLKDSAHALSLEISDGETKAAAYARILAQASERIVATRNQQSVLRDVRRGLLEHGATREEANRVLGLGGGGGGGGGTRQRETYDQAVARLRADAERNAANQTFTEGFNANVRAGQYAASQSAAFYSPGASAARGRRDANELARGAAAGDALARRAGEAANDNSLAGQVRSQFGIVRDEQSRLLRSSETFAQQFSSTVGGAFNAVTSAASNHFAALIEGRETAGEALRGFVHDSLMALAQDSLVKALYNTAQGFAFLASYQEPQAISAFTAAGIYAGIAALAGLGAYATNAPASGASLPAQSSGGGPSRSARAGGGAANDNGNGQTIINVTYSGTIYSREHAANEVVALINDAVERGVRPRMAG